jgi:hypothetical protein
VLEPIEEPVQCLIDYRTLVKVMELYADGRMLQGDASALSKGGMKVNEFDLVRLPPSLTARF